MATITARKRADGTTAYRATIRIKKSGQIIHQETETFDQKRMAEQWAKKRETELQAPGAIQRAKGGETLGDLLDWYIKDYGDGFGRSKLATLKQMRAYEICGLSAINITASDLIDHIKGRREGGAGPATAANDLIWLRVLFKAARPAKGLPLDLSVIDDAMQFCRSHKLISRPASRDRRPTAKELDRLSKYFLTRDGRARTPMQDIMWFAIHSARREDEITRLRWDDNDTKHHTGIVRDAKHPRAKEGNHREFKYTKEAMEIVKRQPKTSEFIFPYDPRTIGAAFARACRFLEIEDLRFHDLRHEATSRLFEAGYSIEEVSQFTLHESWSTLKRYTHLSPKRLKHR